MEESVTRGPRERGKAPLLPLVFDAPRANYSVRDVGMQEAVGRKNKSRERSTMARQFAHSLSVTCVVYVEPPITAVTGRIAISHQEAATGRRRDRSTASGLAPQFLVGHEAIHPHFLKGIGKGNKPGIRRHGCVSHGQNRFDCFDCPTGVRVPKAHFSFAPRRKNMSRIA